MREISFRNDILPLKDKLYRLALRITLNSAEAEDVVQDTMYGTSGMNGRSLNPSRHIA